MKLIKKAKSEKHKEKYKILDTYTIHRNDTVEKRSTKIMKIIVPLSYHMNSSLLL